jgi:hypothetical protein
MKSVTVHNPAAEFLAVLNGRRGKRMTRKSKPNKRNTKRAATAGAAPNRRNGARAHNRRHNRRRNPAAKSIVMGGVFAAAGSIVTNILAGFVPIQASGWMGLAIKLGLAYATGMLAERLGVSGQNANYMAIGGFAGAAGEGISMLMGSVGGAFTQIAPHPAEVPQTVGYLSDIAPFPADLERYALGDVSPQPAFYN